MTRPILIAAGGTGGHMFPALALARQLVERGQPVAMVTDSRGARYLPDDLSGRVIRAGSPSGGLGQRLAGLWSLLVGTIQSLGIVLGQKPVAAACFGGYASVPAGLAARLFGRPLLLHEQNAVFGRANRLLARLAQAIALSFERTRSLPAGASTVVTGNPVRPGFAVAGMAYAPPDTAGPFNLLVIGGSQGARIFSDVVPDAVAALPEALRRRLAIVQQCRPEDLERVRTAYAAGDVAAEVAAFFDDMPARMAAAHLLISRAGASSLTEIMATGRPAILVPYAAAADDHQRANAEALSEAGGALMILQREFSAERLGEALEPLLRRPEMLAEMAGRARASYRSDAAERLADAVLGLVRPAERAR